MSTDIVVQAVPGGLRAVNTVEADKIDRYLGKEMMATVKVPRNLPFHRKFMAMLGVALDMADTDDNFEQFRAKVTAGAGYCDFTTNNAGNLIAVPKSIKFASMDDTEFERLYQDAITYICREYVVDENQLNQMLEFM